MDAALLATVVIRQQSAASNQSQPWDLLTRRENILLINNVGYKLQTQPDVTEGIFFDIMVLSYIICIIPWSLCFF